MALILDIVTTAALYYIVASGLLLIFGVMRLLNFAHGGLITLGGYSAVITTNAEISPWLGMPIAAIMGIIVGLFAERFIVRPLYHRPLDAILATWGLGIIIGQIIVIIFDRGVHFAATPISGVSEVLGLAYSNYRLSMIVFAIVLGGIMTLVLRGTPLGLRARAVIMNEQLADGLGINSGLVRTVTFTLGCALAAVAGNLITPLASVDPNMGVSWLIAAFMLVLVSGSSFYSLATACIVLGGAQVIVSTYFNSVLGAMTIVVLAAIILRIRPRGFSYE